METQKKFFSHDPKSKSHKIITRRKNGTLRVQTVNDDPAMTDPQWGQESDINYIMEKFQKTGQVTHLGHRQGIYGDVSEIPDLLGAAIIVREAQLNFESLDSRVRLKFENDPQKMIDWLHKPENQEEAVQLGLLTRNQKPSNDDPNDDKGSNVPSKKTPAKKTDPPKTSDPE